MKLILKCSCCLLLLLGCAAPYQLPAEYQQVTLQRQTFENPHFRVGGEYLYRTTVTAYGHTFSGLLAAKITAPNAWRVALTTDFGNTLFDFERRDGATHVHYVMPDLNKKMIVRTLTADFQKLLRTHFAITQQYAGGATHVLQSIDEGDMIYLFVSGENLQQQLNTQGKKLYTTIVYATNHITITHHTLRIEIGFRG